MTKTELVDKMRTDLTDQVISKDPDQELVKTLKEELTLANFNDKEWLYDNIATDEDRKLINAETALFE